jgi:hypothetical protein
MGERYCFPIINWEYVNATTLELVKECLVVIGSHARPASALHLGVENGY